MLVNKLYEIRGERHNAREGGVIDALIFLFALALPLENSFSKNRGALEKYAKN